MADDSTQTAQESKGAGAGRHRGPAASTEEPSSAAHGRHRREGEEG